MGDTGTGALMLVGVHGAGALMLVGAFASPSFFRSEEAQHAIRSRFILPPRLRAEADRRFEGLKLTFEAATVGVWARSEDDLSFLRFTHDTLLAGSWLVLCAPSLPTHACAIDGVFLRGISAVQTIPIAAE
ncbi:hypothetical protein T484DRAFT_1913998, partial [Baffinella frigidus]